MEELLKNLSLGLSNHKLETSIVLSTINAMLSLNDFNVILTLMKIGVDTPLPTDTLLHHYLSLLTLGKGGHKSDKEIDKFVKDKQNQSKEGDGDGNGEEEGRFSQELDCSSDRSKGFTQVIGNIAKALRLPDPRIKTIEQCLSRFLERMEEELTQFGWFDVVSQMFSVRAADGQPVNGENRYLHNVIVDNNNKDKPLSAIAGEQGLFGKDVVKKSIFVVQIVKRSQDLDPKDPIKGFLTPVNGLDVLQTTEANDGTKQLVEYKLKTAIGFESVTKVVDNEVIAGQLWAYRKMGDKWFTLTDRNIQSSDSKEMAEKTQVLFYEK